MDPLRDDPWSERLKLDREHGLAAAMEHYRPRLKQMVLLRIDQRLSGRVDPSDVVQETYLDAARQLQSFLDDPQVSVYVWLRRLAWERLLNLRRHHLGAQKRDLRRQVKLPEASSIAFGRALVAPGEGPGSKIARDELRASVERAIARLPAKDQEVILLRHFEDLSNQEVAEAEQVSLGRVVFGFRAVDSFLEQC